MKKSVRSVISKFGFIAIALSLNFFAACEIGLGSSVDVEAPKIEFSETTVDSGAVVRDAFAVFGSWNDDGSIGSITATLKNLSTGAEFSKEGTVGENSWNVAFSPADDGIADGSYELSIVIKDGADHESKISRAFVIDNTPPLVVLSRPSTRAGAATFDSYGQKFTIEGKAADDNDVSLIEVAVYDNADCTGNPLKVISLPNVPLTIESDVATFSSTVANDYSAIYGHTNAQGISARDGGTEQRYCKLVVYDGAQRFPVDGSVQTEADKKGNKVDYYYLNSDFAQLFTDGFKITELYHILNGTYSSNNSRAVSTTDVVTNYLNNPSMHITKGQFKLNPENSPHFVVSARNKLESGHTLDESPLTNGNTRLEVEISPGLDGHLLKKDTIGVYLVCCDLYGNPLKEVNDPNSTSTPPAKMLVPAESEAEAKKIWLIPVNDPATAVNEQEAWADITESGSTYKFKTKYEIGNGAYEEMEVGQNYYVGVTGQDMQPNDIMPDGLYGFQLITSGLNIEVGTSYSPTWLSWASGAATANKSVTVRLTYPTDNRPFEIKRGSDSSNLSTLPGATGINASPYNDSFDITSENHPTSLVYKVSGNNSAESNPKTVTFKYDNTPPQADITSVPNTTDTQQGTITFKGTASDIVNGEEESGVKTVYVQVIDKTNTSHKTPEPGTSGAIPPASYSGGEWLCQVTPSDYAGANNGFAEEGPKTLKITVVDGVGLKTERTQDFIFDTAAPKITLGKYKQYGETGEGTAFGDSRSLLVGKTFTVNGTLVERYGLNATNGFVIEQKWTKFGSSSVENTKKKDITPAANGNWSVTLPFNGTDGTDYDNDTIVGNHSADGTYTYTISAKDKAEKSDNDGIQFSATLKTDGPNITISSPVFETVSGSQVTKNWQKSKDIMISGKASSPAAVSKVYWTTDSTKTEGGEWTDWEEAEGAENWNFTVSVENDAADHKVYIAAIDSLGNFTSKKEYTLKVDSSAPNVAPKFFQIGSGEVQTANGTIYISKLSGNAQNLTVYGTYSETVSGPYVPQTEDTLRPLAFTIDGTAKTATITYSDTDISSGLDSANFNATTPSLTTRSWKAVFENNVLSAGGFVVTARNGAGLSKENSDLTINEDSTAPEIGASIIITNSSFKETITENSEAVDYYYVNNKTTPVISGTVSDANLLSVAVKAECTGKTAINKSLNNNPFNWSFELKDGTTNDMKDWTNAANGSCQTSVTLTVTDKAGNKTEKKLKFIFDTTPPLAKHEWDNKEKDLIFRIGEANNVLDELSVWDSSITVLDENKDKNVGGKYKKGTYGNSETIRIRGAFEDSGSGVDTVYYKKFTTQPTEAQINAFIANPDTQKTGNAIKPKSVTQRVSFTNSSNNREFTEVERTFTELISDLTANNTNYIVILAVDKVGNIGLDYAEKSNYDGDTSTKAYKAKKIEDSYYTLNIDTIVPENTVDSTVDTNGYVNPETTSEITISGVVNSGKLDDGTAPVRAADAYIELKVNGKRILTSTAEGYAANQNNGVITLETTSPYSKTNAHWTASIVPSVVFNGVNTGSFPVYAIISDGAGNNQTLNIGSINIDKTAPTVNINTISDADKDTADVLDVNGELTITGTASDTEKLSSVTVKYKKSTDAETEWTTKTQESDSTPSNWKVKFDTTSLDNTTSYDICVTATDGAGNSTSDTKTIYVNQDSDRPVIKFTNLDRVGAGTDEDPYSYILKYGTNARIEGSVSDDDADSNKVVTTFKASTSPITSATATPVGSLVTYTVASGDFTFQPGDIADGLKTIYFYIRDNKGKEYYSTYTAETSPELNRPYQLYKTDAKTNNIQTLTYKSDKTPPESTVSLNAYNAASASATGTDTTITANGVSLGANCVVGGTTKKWINLSVTSSDDNGIRGVVVKLEQGSTIKYYRSNDKVEEEGVTAYETTTTEVAPQDDTDAGNDYTYITDRIDLSAFAEGQVKVTVKAYDQSGLYSNQQSAFVVDNTGPEFALSGSTKDGDIVYGIQSNTVGGSVSAIDVEKIYYAVSLSSTAPTATAGDADADYTTDAEGNRVVKNNLTGKWNLVRNAGTSATLVMYDGSTTVENAFLSQSLRSWLMALQNKTSEQLNEDDTRVDMYIHFMAVDECGNKGTPVKRKLSVYPNGDKPVIELVYPENKSDGTEPSLSGTIRVYGYASAAIGRVEATYLQIDPDYDGTWKTTEAANDTTANTWRKALKDAITGTKANYPIEKIGSHNLYGIKAEGTGNWNLPINGYNEFDPDSGTRTIAIRIYALSESGKVSEPYTQVLKIDPNAPHIGASDDDVDESSSTALANRKYRLQIVDFTSGTGNVGDFTKISETKAYKAEMWMKGQKYLIASVYDDSGIKTITLNEKVQGVAKKVLVEEGVAKTDAVIESHVTGQDKAIRVSQVTCGFAGKKNFNICIPLPTGSGSGSLEWEIEAVEDSTNNNRCKETIIINYDNTAPKLGTSDHAKYGIDADIHQSNGFYTMKSWATDADGDNKVSGMMGVAFYFMRRGSSSTRVYDPMYKDNYAAGKHNYVDVTGANPSGITYSNGLFWKHQTGITVTSSSKLESVLTVTADDNIHTGGLALIGGTIYRISDVSGTTVKVEGQVSLAETSADFALALVVDNLSKKEKTDGRSKIETATTYGYGYYGPHDTADDGDLMVEDWDGTSVEGQWTAIINSANIPDGPIELHYVAFDKSQNYAVGIVGNVTNTVTTGTNNDYWDYNTLDVTANAAITGSIDSTNKLATNFYYAFSATQPAYVSNNAPRIAGVTVGCDYNGDGSIAAGEKSSKYVGEANRFIGGEGADNIVRKATSVAKIFNASSDGTDTGNAMKTIKDKMEIELEIIGGNGNLFYQYKRDNGAYTQGSAMVAGTDYTRNTSEGETTDFVGQSYYITTKLKKLEFTDTQLKTWYTSNTNKSWWTIEVWDSTEETTPFTNSQYATLKLPLSIQVNDTVAPNTYINDLYWNSSTDNSVYINTSGDEDKLEGHIELKDYLGTGFTAANYGTDDDKISGKVVFRGYAYDNKRLKSLNWGIKDKLTGTIKQAWPQTYITPVSYNPETGKWGVDPADDDNATEWTETGSSGNASVGLPYYYFKVYDDEDHGAYLNENGHKVYWELIVDTSYVQEPGASSTTDAWAVGKDLYVYVEATDNSNRTTNMNPTVVTTGTDAQKLRPNYKVDVVPYITGIKSLLSDNRSSNGRYQLADNETGVELIGYNLKQGSANLGINVPSATGAYSTTVHGCVTINNLNNNEATASTPAADKGKYKNKYNYQPSTYNKTLTDDVNIDLWQFNNRAAQTNTGFGFIQEPVMKFNPRNGNLGFSFSNGANKFSMAQGQTNSYILWEYNYASYVRNALAFDERGRSHGISVGIDTEPSSGKSGRMNYFYSGWGRSAYDDRAGNFSNDTNSNHIDCIGIPNGNNLNSNTPPSNDWANCIIMEQRFKSVTMAATSKGSDNYTASPRVYIAYYDDIREQITFKYGEITGGTRTTYGQIQSSGNPNGGDGRAFSVSGDYWSVIADGGSATPYKPGEFVDIAVKPGTSMETDVVCAVWFDATNNNLMYSYKVNPGTDHDASTRTGTYTTGYWSNATILKRKCGEYCKIAIDANGGVHITAYDKGEKGVGYVYLPSYDSTYSEANNYYIIDAVNGPYDELGIDVAVDGTGTNGKAYPTISYYANGTPKMATYSAGILKGSANKPEKAWDNNSFTGKWDICFLPTESNLLKDHINVAQPKGQDGVRARVSTTNNFASAGTEDSGTVTGNTTTNPILGYAIREGAKGYMEIAQRK